MPLFDEFYFVVTASTVTLPVLSSTLLLTGLMCVGLMFFIRAASKDRTKTIEYVSDQSADCLTQQLVEYFENRAYQRLSSTDTSPAETRPTDWLQFKGWVRPSVFLAIFLTILAMVGLLCVSFILAVLFPQGGVRFVGLLLLAPIATIFYWKKAGREEQIAFKVLDLDNGESDKGEPDKGARSQLTLQGHRDEMIQLMAIIPLERLDSAAASD